ncbi:MAG TPA: hypothetical protein VJC08_01810, partial [bacterium]|nr:hypothetical protein [bacterium]
DADFEKRPIAYDPEQGVKFRQIGRFLVKFEPRRGPARAQRADELTQAAVQVERPLEKGKFNFDAITNPRELLATVEVNGRIRRVFTNKNPILRWHSLIAAEHPRAQVITREDILDFLTLLEGQPDIWLNYNSLEAAASVNDMHAQTINLDAIAYNDETGKDQTYQVLIDPSKAQWDYTVGPVRVGTLPLSYDFPDVIFQSSDREALAKLEAEFAQKVLIQGNIPHNLLFTDSHTNILFARTNDRAVIDRDQKGLGITAFQHLGIYPVYAEDIFKNITEADILRELEAVAYPREEFKRLYHEFFSEAQKRSEMRTTYHEESEKILIGHIHRNKQGLEAALKGGADFDDLFVIATPETVQATEEILGHARGTLFREDRTPTVKADAGHGSLAGLLAVHELLQEKYGPNYTAGQLRNKRVATYMMAGKGSRQYALTASTALRNKGLLTTPAGDQTNVEQKIGERFMYDDPNVKEGLEIFSVDSAEAPQYWPVLDEVKDPEIDGSGKVTSSGKGGFQMYGHTLRLDRPVDRQEIQTLGLIVTPQPGKAGGQEILMAVEKPDPETLDFLKNEKIIQSNEVNVNHANYYLSWPAHAWLVGKIKEFNANFSTPPSINWVEAFFEAATFGQKYPERYRARHSDLDRPGIVEFLIAMGKEGKEKFGMSFVNEGPDALYLHTNRPAQTHKIQSELYERESYRYLFGVGIVGSEGDEWYKPYVSPEVHKYLAGRIVGRHVKFDETVKLKDLAQLIGPHAMLLGRSGVQVGSIIDGTVVDSWGILQVPEDATIQNVLSPNLLFRGSSGDISIDYLVRARGKNKPLKRITFDVSVGFNPWEMRDGKARIFGTKDRTRRVTLATAMDRVDV